ncbi:MAG TPA: protein-glutamate O-methyltransferase [Rhizomicrobium sp.]|jgi:chemotaxis protein methyltransferase CheR|nr:protein-glutamate O-methyltransferase [Rhizomicrobium sp.]
MNSVDFAYIAALLKERSGLIVTQEKTYLFETRLLPIARRNNLASLEQLIAAMRTGRNEALIGSVVDAMTTNETSFFRDRHPFEAMKKVLLPGLIERRAAQKHLRIWSAACSTGQEAYSLAMMLRDDFPLLAGWRVEIIGTDISPSVLTRAREGVYSTFEVQRGLPIQLLVRHFEQIGEQWRIKPELRRMADFRPFNLLGDLAPLGQFDIILCRNVLIYFDLPVKARVLEGMHQRLARDGGLILGGAESVFGICDRFTDIPGLRGVYAPGGSGRAAWPAAAKIGAASPAMPMRSVS